MKWAQSSGGKPLSTFPMITEPEDSPVGLAFSPGCILKTMEDNNIDIDDGAICVLAGAIEYLCVGFWSWRATR